MNRKRDTRDINMRGKEVRGDGIATVGRQWTDYLGSSCRAHWNDMAAARVPRVEGRMDDSRDNQPHVACRATGTSATTSVVPDAIKDLPYFTVTAAVCWPKATFKMLPRVQSEPLSWNSFPNSQSDINRPSILPCNRRFSWRSSLIE